MDAPVLAQQDILGSWHLVSVALTGPQASTQAAPFGGSPTGILHYLGDGRMAVMIQHSHRPAIAGGRKGGSEAEWAQAARSFTAYAGRYSVKPGVIIHHVELNSFPNEIGFAYSRMARLVQGCLVLETPPDLPADQRAMRLVWRRLTDSLVI